MATIEIEGPLYESRHEALHYLQSLEVSRRDLGTIEGLLEYTPDTRSAVATLLKCAERRARRYERELNRPTGARRDEMTEINFDEWLAKAQAIVSPEWKLDYEAWKVYYNEGYTPEEAVREEVENG